jgi:hypothetical protein
MPAVPDMGCDFDAESFAATLDAARVDFITVFAKCNLGMTYYPTKVGVAHPSLSCDMLGEMIDACHRRGIAVAAYFNVGLDHEMAQRHRDWAALNEQGQVHSGDHLNHFFRTMCFGGPWADHLEAMIKEVLCDYEVDGLFLDCWAWDRPCYGDECVRALRDAGQDVLDHQTVVAAHNENKLKFARRVRDLIDTHRPEATYYLNGVPFLEQLDLASHLEIESLPGSFWGYMDFPWKVRALRGAGIHLVRQTGRFHHGWGDFGGLRTQAALDYECLQAVAHGIACGIGDHLHPRGQLCGPAYERIGSIFTRIEALQTWTADAIALTDTAVVIDGISAVEVSPTESDAVLGVTRLLEELRCQFDLVDTNASFDSYDLLILIDPLRFDSALLEKIERHLKRGGAVLATGAAGLLADSDVFADGWPVEYEGPADLDPGFFELCDASTAGMPDMPITINSTMVRVKPRDAAVCVAQLIQPYFNRHWDGFHGHVYMPPDKATGCAAATVRGQVAHLAFDVFSDYGRRADPLHRQLVKVLLSRIAPSPLVIADDLPSYARVTLTEQPSRTIVHVLSYLPERRTAEQDVVEEPIVLRDVQLSIKVQDVKRVYSAPLSNELQWQSADGRITLHVPEIAGYQMIIIERT